MISLKGNKLIRGSDLVTELIWQHEVGQDSNKAFKAGEIFSIVSNAIVLQSGVGPCPSR